MDIWNLKGGQLNILTQSEIEEIHQRALDVLQQVGCYFDHEEALTIFAENGAVVDRVNKIVKLPRNMVEAALRHCPSSMLLAARDPKKDIHAEADRVYFGPGCLPVKVRDLETCQIRPGTLKDCENFVRLIDALAFIHFFKSMVTPCDVNPKLIDLYMVNAAYNNTTKQISSAIFSPQGALDLYRMGMAVAGGEAAFRQRPMMLVNFLAISPLAWDQSTLEGVISVAQKSYPMILGSAPQSGVTAPTPLAGHLVLHVAETLAGITLAQLVCPGVPIMWGITGTIANMYTGMGAYGSVELALITAGTNQIAKFYHIPTFSSGGLTDSKISDAQAGVEKALQILTVALSSGNYIHQAAGALESIMTCSYEQYVIDNEMLGMVARLMDGIRVNPETLSFEQIKAVGPRGNFLELHHTLDHIHSEHYLPRLFDRNPHDTWVEKGSEDIQKVARRKAREILSTHKVDPLPVEVQTELKAIIRNAEKTYGS